MTTATVKRRRTWYRSSATLMGSTAEILVDGDRSMIVRAFERLRRLEATWTRFRTDSELASLHRSDGRWTAISDDLAVALDWCRRLHAETEGRFDPTIRRALEASGYDTTFSAVVDSETPLPPERAVPGIDAIELDRGGRSARLRPGTSIDLGGIGKGLAADLVVNELIELGARSVYVSLGGDIHAAGEPPESGSWPVPLLHPITRDPLAVHPLVDGALVMSTTALRRWRRGGVEAHHIIDPRTGRPAVTDVVAVAVAARSAARAEGLAKAAIVAGSVDGARLLRRAEVRAWIIGVHAVVVVEEPSCSP